VKSIFLFPLKIVKKIFSTRFHPIVENDVLLMSEILWPAVGRFYANFITGWRRGVVGK